MTVYHAILSALISLLTSGVVSAFITHKLASSEKQREIKRQKLEQLYTCSVDYHYSLLRAASMAAAYHAGTSSRDVLVNYMEDNPKMKQDRDTLTMISNLYFPKLVPFCEGIRKHEDAIGNAGLKQAIMGETPDINKSRALRTLNTTHSDVFDNFNKQLFKAGVAINK